MNGIYQKAREKYKPKDIRILFIAESPPAFDKKPRHFYIENVPEKDFLFIETMRTLYPSEFINYNRNPEKKRYFLNRFKSDGYFLIDAIDKPINKLPDEQADELINQNKKTLIDFVQRLCNKSTKIILIKANIHRLLYFELKGKQFNVLNDKPLPFPLYQWTEKYRTELARLLLNANISNRKLSDSQNS